MASTSGGKGWAARFLVAGLWLVTALEVMSMGRAGSMKFTRPEMWIGYFADFGYPAWFSYVIGGLELAGVVLLLIPRVAPYAALGLVIIMLGALQAVTTHDTALGVDGPIVHLVLLGIILAGRWRGRWRSAGAL